MKRLVLLTGLVLLVVLACARQPKLPESFFEAQGIDGIRERYYSADHYLTKALEFMARFQVDPVVRGQRSVSLLPAELREIDYEPARIFMKEMWRRTLRRQDPRTGLVLRAPGVSYEGLHRSGDLGALRLFLQWFPQDSSVIRAGRRWAEGFWRYQRAPEGGLYDRVDPRTGWPHEPWYFPTSYWTFTSYYGNSAEALAWLSKITGDPRYKAWADSLTLFVWRHRPNRRMDLPPSTISIKGGVTRWVDTDGIYWVRALFRTFTLTGDSLYRELALRATNAWIRYGWRDQWNQFVACCRADGLPGQGLPGQGPPGQGPPDTAIVFQRIYGDGKYNTLRMLIYAYRETGDSRYLDLFDRFWNQLEANGKRGMLPQVLDKGRIALSGRGYDPRHTYEGLDNQQSIFLDILVDAYRFTGLPRYLEKAKAFADNLLRQDEHFLRPTQVGRAYLKLALAAQPIRRFRIRLPHTGTRLTFSHNGNEVLSVRVPTEAAVVYLPASQYDLQIRWRGGVRRGQITLRTNREMDWQELPEQ